MTNESRTAGVEEVFAAFFTPELATRLTEPGAFPPPLRLAAPHFLFVLVRDDDCTRTAPLLSEVVDLAISSEGLVEAIAGSLVVVTFGSVGDTDLPPEELESRRRSLVAKLSAALRQDVVILHGKQDALVGLTGGSLRYHYGSLFKRFSSMLATLAALQWGEVREAQGLT